MKGRIVLGVALAFSLLVPACARPSSPAPAVFPAARAAISVEDGERFAILRSVRLAGADVHVVADYVRVLRGAEASAEASARDPLFTGPMSYLVVNDEREDATLRLAPDARIRCLDRDGPSLRDVTPAAFVERWLASDAGDAVRRDTYRVVVRGGAVTLLEQQHLR